MALYLGLTFAATYTSGVIQLGRAKEELLLSHNRYGKNIHTVSVKNHVGQYFKAAYDTYN